MKKAREQLRPLEALLERDQQTIKSQGYCHFVQSAGWAELKGETAWKTKKLDIEVNERLYPMFVYTRGVPLLGRLHYVPKIAVINLADIDSLTQKMRGSVKGGIAVKIEIDSTFSQELHEKLLKSGWLPTENVQYANTVLVDLSKAEDELLKSFKKRARWEINAAGRRGVKVEKVETTPKNLKLMYDMLQATSQRGNFRTRKREFTYKYWRLFSRQGQGSLYLARHENDVLAAAYIIHIGKRGHYKDGASTRQKGNLFASRYMQWFIMKDLKSQGYNTYDLGGLPTREELERGDMAGVYTFKTGFGEPIKLQGSYILPLDERRFKSWLKIEPKLLKLYVKTKNEIWY